MWRANQLFIEAADSNSVTVVSLLITDQGLNLTRDTPRSFPLGILPARARKELWVLAHREPQADLKVIVERVIEQSSRILEPQLGALRHGEVLSACLLGVSPEDVRYMLVVPIRVH